MDPITPYSGKMTLIRRIALWVGGVVPIIVGIGFLYVVLERLDVQRISAIGGVIGALATSAAAIAAWRAAVRSDLTAQRARQALGAATRPEVHASFTSANKHVDGAPGKPIGEFTVWNASRWPAKNIKLEYSDGQGWHVETRVTDLPGAQDSHGRKDQLRFAKSTIEVEAPPPGSPAWGNWSIRPELVPEGGVIVESTTVVEYSDEHEVSRWKRVSTKESSFGVLIEGVRSSSSGLKSKYVERIY